MKNNSKLEIRSEYLNIVLSVLLVISLCANVILAVNVVGNSANTSEELSEVVSDEASTDEVEETTVSDEEYSERMASSTGVETELTDVVEVNDVATRNELADGLKEITQYLRDNNAYIAVQTSDTDYDTYVYNNHGEVFLESAVNGLVGVFMNDGETLMIAGTEVYWSDDLDILSLVDRAADLMKDESYTVYKYDGEGVSEGYLELKGWQQIYDLYSVAGEDYSEYMVKQFMSAVDGDATVDIYFGYDDNYGIAVASLLNINGESGVETLTSWNLNGYSLLGDWQLEDEWYTGKEEESYDFANALENTYSQLGLLIDEVEGESVESTENVENTDETDNSGTGSSNAGDDGSYDASTTE